jgi:hypothetical protein
MPENRTQKGHDMDIPKRLTRTVCAVAAGFALLSGTAFANTAVHGADYSRDRYDETNLLVYDGTGDGHSVYSEYYMTGSTDEFRLENFNGYGTSVSRGSIYYIKSHRVCVNLTLRPDPCSGLVAASS